MQEWYFFIAASVLRSMVKPSREENLTARIMRTGSSWKRIAGSPMERMTLSLMSFMPPTQSMTLKSSML